MEFDPATSNFYAFQRAWNAGHEAYIASAKQCDDYFLGYQWTEEDKKKLEDAGRPALTLNEILQVIGAIRGHYSTTRADLVFKPKRNGATVETAQILTRLIDQIMDANDYQQREAQMVEDGWIEDRGYLDARLSFEENMLGEIAITVLDPRTVVLDPDAKEYDPRTWSEVSIDRWLSLDDIEALYGKAKRDKVEVAAMQQNFGQNYIRYETYGTAPFHGPVTVQQQSQVRSVRVIDRQYKKMMRVREFVDLGTGESRPVPDHWDEKRIQAVSQSHGLFVRSRIAKRIWWTVSSGPVTLHDKASPYDDFTVVPYFPIFRRGRPSGIVRHLIDPQDQLNKVESQILHVVNTTANSGWTVEAGSLVNMTEQDLEQRGAETGLVLVYGRNRQKPEKIQPNQVPSGLENYARKALSYIKDIPGASALLGTAPNSEVSGVTLDKARANALSGLQMAFDNLNYTRRLLARHLLRLIQKFYTEPRIYRVTNWRNPEMPDEEIAINMQAMDDILNDVSIGEYDVVVSSAPARDSAEETAFAESIQMRDIGVMIPDHHVILSSNLPGKRQIAAEVKQMQGLGEPTEAQQMVQQLEIRRAVAEIANLEADVLKTQAEAMQMQVKAQTMGAAEQRQAFEMVESLQQQQAKMEADLMKAAANLQNKLDLAQLHVNAKAALTRFTQVNSTINKEKDNETALQTERLRAAREARRPVSGGSR